jgi:hypothetical protein
MQKRQLRLSTPTQIRERLAGFLNKKINIVLNDNTVLLVKLLAISGNELTVQNMRLRQQHIAMAAIYEIIIDLND